jgi:hypothetical protein
MSPDKTVKKVFLGKPDRIRKAGRPNLRWLYCIENDLKSIGLETGEEEGRRQIGMGYYSEGGTVKLWGPYANEEEEEFDFNGIAK